MIDISSTLEERGSRYGSFDTHAEITQQLKFVINKSLFDQKKSLTPSMKEALDMIAHKIGRIINGDPFYADSWIDIAGYAQLVADELDKDELDAAVTVIEEEVNESHSQFGPVTDEHREWAREILNDLAPMLEEYEKTRTEEV